MLPVVRREVQAVKVVWARPGGYLNLRHIEVGNASKVDR